MTSYITKPDPNDPLTIHIQEVTKAFENEYPKPHSKAQQEELIGRIARARENFYKNLAGKKDVLPEHRRVGLAVGGLVRSATKFRLLRDVATTLVRLGWGINSTAQTPGDVEVVKAVHSKGGIVVGFFVDRMGHPYIKQLVTREVNDYGVDTFNYAERVYNSMGKSWDFLSWEQQKSIARLVEIARWSHVCAVFDSPDRVSDMFVRFAGAYKRPVFFLPHDTTKLMDYVIAQNERDRTALSSGAAVRRTAHGR